MSVLAHASTPAWTVLRSREEFNRPDLPLLTVVSAVGVAERDLADGRAPSEDLSGYRVVHEGDLVINKLWARFGAYGVAPLAGIISPAYWVLVADPTRLEPRFLHHALRSSAYLAEIGRISRNLPPNGYDLSWEQFRRLDVPIPPLDVQRRVADFLDEQVALLDRAIHLRKQQTILLEEVATARLTDAYERLCTDYGTSRFATQILRLEQGWSPQCDDRLPDHGEYGVLKAGCVNGGTFNPTQMKALPVNVEPRLEYLVRPGNLLMSRASGSLDLIGSAAVVPEGSGDRVLLCDKIYRLTLRHGQVSELLLHLMRARPVREAIKLGTSGAEGMANNLPSGTVRGLRMPVVPTSKQKALAELLSREHNEFTLARGRLGASSALLVERKQALITAAVTGEFDVMAASARSVA